MKKLVIAIVEDDADDQDFIVSSLKETGNNLDIRTFSNGADFFEFISTGTDVPDLIITDLRMPVISGFDVISKIKNDERTKDIHIIVLSTSGREQDISKAKELGAGGYYVKPYTFKEYDSISKKIIEAFGKGLFSFSMVAEEFLKSFLLLLPAIVRSQKPGEVV